MEKIKPFCSTYEAFSSLYNSILGALQQYSQLSGQDCLSELQQYIQELSNVNNVVYDTASQVQPLVLGTQPVPAKPAPNIELLQ